MGVVDVRDGVVWWLMSEGGKQGRQIMRSIQVKSLPCTQLRWARSVGWFRPGPSTFTCFGVSFRREPNLLITNSTLRLPSGELHTNLAELHTPCTLYHVHGNKIYHVLKIRYIAISGGIFLDAARWRLLDSWGERQSF